jgi:hypothetical protein
MFSLYSGETNGMRSARAPAAICIDPPHGTPPNIHTVLIRRAMRPRCAPQRSRSRVLTRGCRRGGTRAGERTRADRALAGSGAGRLSCVHSALRETGHYHSSRQRPYAHSVDLLWEHDVPKQLPPPLSAQREEGSVRHLRLGVASNAESHAVQLTRAGLPGKPLNERDGRGRDSTLRVRLRGL